MSYKGLTLISQVRAECSGDRNARKREMKGRVVPYLTGLLEELLEEFKGIEAKTGRRLVEYALPGGVKIAMGRLVSGDWRNERDGFVTYTPCRYVESNIKSLKAASALIANIMQFESYGFLHFADGKDLVYAGKITLQGKYLPAVEKIQMGVKS